MLLRIVSASSLATFAVFCAFGFLASHEPPGSPGIRIIYAALGISSLLGVGRVLVPRSRGGSCSLEPRVQ